MLIVQAHHHIIEVEKAGIYFARFLGEYILKIQVIVQGIPTPVASVKPYQGYGPRKTPEAGGESFGFCGYSISVRSGQL
jgi:hypothetical protein